MLLRKGKMSAGEIAAHFEMTGATVSYHLSQLKKADLILEERKKNYIYYQLNTSVFERSYDVDDAIFQSAGKAGRGKTG